MPHLRPPPTSASARLPPWLKTRLPGGDGYKRIKALMEASPLHTVCEEARCPNLSECWAGGTATFMVMGDTCTRGCRFCSVATSLLPALPDPGEPSRLAQTLARLSLTYAVVTTVCRDDLPDQGAGHVAACLRAAKAAAPGMLLEFLAQDFRGDEGLLREVVSTGCDVLSHNLETVERLTPRVRDARAGYRQSLEVLAAAKRMRPGLATKSSLMLGLGETELDLVAAFADLRAAGVEILTLGQYLRPSAAGRHLPVAEYLPPARFDELGGLARNMGFLYVASGPFVRSSYRAGELFLKGMISGRGTP